MTNIKFEFYAVISNEWDSVKIKKIECSNKQQANAFFKEKYGSEYMDIFFNLIDAKKYATDLLNDLLAY